MKKIFFGFCLLLMSLSATAQDKPYEKKQEVKVSWGYMYYDDNFDRIGDWAGGTNLQYDNSHYYWDDVRSTEPISVSYMTDLKRWLALGAAFAYDRNYQHCRDVATDRVQQTQHIARYTLLPMARFTFLNRPMVRLYGAAGLGLTYKNDTRYGSTDNSLEGVLQLTLFGVSVGKKLFGSAELGLGPLGLVNVGFGYRF